MPEDSEEKRNSVQVVTIGNAAFVRVSGCGSFRDAPSLKQFGMAAMKQGCSRMIVDLSQCAAADSTFMGVLVGLSLRMTRQHGGRLRLTGTRPIVASRMRELGVDRVVEIEDGAAGGTGKNTAEPQPDGLRHLERCATEADKRLGIETSLAAHQDLSGLRPENEPKFKDVLAFLQEDLKIAEL